MNPTYPPPPYFYPPPPYWYPYPPYPPQNMAPQETTNPFSAPTNEIPP